MPDSFRQAWELFGWQDFLESFSKTMENLLQNSYNLSTGNYSLQLPI